MRHRRLKSGCPFASSNILDSPGRREAARGHVVCYSCNVADPRCTGGKRLNDYFIRRAIEFLGPLNPRDPPRPAAPWETGAVLFCLFTTGLWRSREDRYIFKE